ncbi:pyridine nucleotide-disulfide oxidoreductase [Mycobacterium sp. PS03-16]|uniref:FAD-dependent oxidoreductase n=1 Tax=Mycobacterium sp. PS03-16 TaxID=2559611 RepID=UPI0010732526|nr:FAD-dependent oxidoreductase [Mycobacterium sp. PS03-16]TFV55801.1 pyridine nucleotide-disulfide oxidoreductase [Mycobacterium sp. PS03-16]
MSAPRVVVAGLGDSGLLTAIRLARHAEVVGIAARPGLVSGQELGVRLARPDAWARDYWISFDRFRALDRVRTEHATLTGVDLAARKVFAQRANGSALVEQYDALVIATGVTNGFWRTPGYRSAEDVAAALRADHERLAAARSVLIVGGGAAAVSSAANVALAWPGTRVTLCFPGPCPLTTHHPRVWTRIARRLDALGVVLRPGHRAVVPDDFACDRITAGPVRWSTGQPDADADAVLWTIGRVRPNTGWLPAELLDGDGFVRVTSHLKVVGQQHVWAIGDAAATDPLRSSARNRADKLLAANIRADAAGRPLRAYRAPARRWGSVLGVQPDGLEVFGPNGRAFRFPAWSIDRVLQPWIVRRAIYGGVRPVSGPAAPRRWSDTS